MINAEGENPNSFYQNVQVARPVISPKSTGETTEAKTTFEYDIPTRKGGIYHLLGEERP
jgi:hypothetical protein